VQSEILSQNRNAPLQVYVDWMPMLPGDSRPLIDQRVLSDPRVTYFWDPNRLVGDWFSRHVWDSEGTTWDAFFLYGRDARWDSTPGPLAASGGSVIGARDDLRAGFYKVEAAPPG
jgi:hypothetical protein